MVGADAKGSGVLDSADVVFAFPGPLSAGAGEDVAEILGKGICVVDFKGEDDEAPSFPDSTDSAPAAAEEALTIGRDVVGETGKLGIAGGAEAGRDREIPDVEAAGFGGLETTGFPAAAAVAPVFAASPLRNNPRATRSVPFACSTLIGLVRTRFAPIRKAFATPTCPSTTATANDAWLFGALRALLNNKVAFCSLSQSTTTASKDSAINFLTAAKGSVQAITAKSNSLRTCVTVRAVFSSGQNRSAW